MLNSLRRHDRQVWWKKRPVHFSEASSKSLRLTACHWRTLFALDCGEGTGMQETSALLRGPRFLPVVRKRLARATSLGIVSIRMLKVAVDMLAMKPSQSDAERRPVEFQPPRNYLCYLRYDSRVFLSGYTSDKETLDDQVPQVISAVAGGLTVAGTGWDKLVKVSLFLHRSHKLETLKNLLGKGPAFPVSCQIEFGFVDGYAGEKSQLEIEATALMKGSEAR